jgi:hypothetical protein
MPAETMISCDALTKRFGHFTAVDHVSFAVAKGSIFGFLGQNGVAAGILPAVEGAHLAARKKPQPFGWLPKTLKRSVGSPAISAGLEARLYGRQDACRYIPS